jgi:biotin operon repressor
MRGRRSRSTASISSRRRDNVRDWNEKWRTLRPLVRLFKPRKEGRQGEALPYSHSYAMRIVRNARRKAGLPEHVTLTACRHGGMTELGDASLTEQGVMASVPLSEAKAQKRRDAEDDQAPRKRGLSGVLDAVQVNGGSLSQRKLARQIGVARRTVERALGELAAAGAVVLGAGRTGTRLAASPEDARPAALGGMNAR